MKRLILLLLVLIINAVQAFCVDPDFTFSSPTDSHGNLLPPLKSAGSYQFQIKVTNKGSDPFTLSIDKGSLIPWDSWISIDNNSQTIAGNGSVTFLITETIPVGTSDNDYSLTFVFKAKDATNFDHYINWKILTAIVDNTPPELPSVQLDFKTSTKIKIFFQSYDSRSIEYTNADPSSGLNGIKSYTLTLKNGSSVVETRAIDPVKDQLAYVFNSLSGNTNYTNTVTANDLAGNTITTNPLTITTPPGAPTNFVSTFTSYCKIGLSWTSMPGATSYYIWADSITPVEVSTPSYTFTGLTPGRAYHFSVRAQGVAGMGDITTKDFSTQSVTAPIFTSTLATCTSDLSVQISPVNEATSYLWTVTSPLTINGSLTGTTSTNSVMVHSNATYGLPHISVYAVTSCGINSKTASDIIKIGKPVISSNFPLAFWDGATYNNACNLQNYTTNMNIINANYVEWTRIAANPTSTSWYQTGNNINFYFFAVNQTAVYNISAANVCGATSNQFGFKSIDCSGGGGGCDVTYSIYPNPASESVKIVPNIPAPCGPTLQAASLNGTISVYTNQGTLKKSLLYKYYGETNIDVSGLDAGLYYIKISDGKSIQSLPLVVKH
jgi:hypothetical protein